MSPTVSIIIPTFNRADFVAEAVLSVLTQGGVDLEVLVVDDGSTDQTESILLAQVTDTRVRYIAQSNLGRSAARNHGISVARGEFVGFLDSDDLYLPNCLQNHLNVFRDCPQTGLTVGGYAYLDEAGGVQGERQPWSECADLSLVGWLFNCLAMPGSILVRRQWLEHVGGFDRQCEIAEDWDLFLRLAQAGCEMRWVKTSVCQYRQHSGNSFRTLTLHHQGSLQALRKLFDSTNLDSPVRENSTQAVAQAHALFARRALALNQLALFQSYLRQAVQLRPNLTRDERIDLTQFVLTSNSPRALSVEARAILQIELGTQPAELRQAQARVQMGLFFKKSQQTSTAPQAIRHLGSALKLDPRWLLNRGVLSFSVRVFLGVFNKSRIGPLA